MASTSTQKAASSSYSPPQWMYDVFLSFRGEDTRNNFTGHLYSNLVQGGIDTIEPALWQAIEESRFSIVVFSRDYASSTWCLDELVKIVQCMKEMGHTALPVFYDVDPSEVSNQSTGDYKKAFIEHKEKFSENPDMLQTWSDCLSTVANLSGWDVRNRDESQSIKRILDWIQCKLSFTLPSISKNLVGIDSRLKVLNDYMDEKANDILFIGISGMGGMGKTTIARVMYDRIRWQFEGSCFLANVTEVFIEKDGPSRLQEQLLSEITMELPTARDSSRRINLIKRRLRLKKVLLILDDVDDEEQIQMLAAEHGSFGPGSRIIITSRDEHVLDRHGVTRIYQTKELSDEDALKLFSWKAFKRDQPDKELWDMSKQVVGYADGLPLALEVIGSFLHRRGIREWKSAIDRMKYIPDRKIIDVLLISFDSLHVLEQKIFLDIACFLKGMKKDRIIRLLDSCGYHAYIGMKALMEKSLISVSRDEIWMHNLLQQMGEDIVRRESPEEPGRRSRLYAYKDVCDALKDNTGKIETIFLDMPRAKEAQWSMKAFSKMTRLRLLKIHNVDVSEGPEYLSNELRFLEWHAYPSKSLPVCFQPEELVELYMSCSSIEQLWYGRKKLQFVNLVNCISLRILPSNLEMESLKACTLNGCSKLDKFPDIVGNMNCLRELRLDETAIAELPSSFHCLVGLVLLSMSGCKNLKSIPSGISGLKSLKKLDVSDCSELKSIPENLGKVEILPSLSSLCSLEKLDLRACNLGEGAVPEDIGFLSSLRSLNLSKNNFGSLPRSINQLSRLEKLALKDCVMLESLPEVPLNVQKVKLDGCLRLKEIPNPIKLSSMKRSEFKCLNCWELYKHNGQNNMGLKMLEKYLQGSLPRPGFGIVVPGNNVPDWFNHQSKESSIRVQVPRNKWMGFAACVAFSTYGKSRLFCYFKVDGQESYPSPMYIGCNTVQVVSDHLWLFYLSFDYLKDLKEQKNEAFNILELSFDSYEQGVKVKNCGVYLVNSPSTPSWQSPTGHLIVASKEAASTYIDSVANSYCYNQWMHDVFYSFRGVHSSNNFTHLYTTLIQRGIIRNHEELEFLRAIELNLLGEIQESGLSVIIFARDYACSPFWAGEIIKIGGFIKKMKPDTVFPVSTISYNVEQSKVDERTESYTIVFDKDEEDFSEYKKLQRWMNILTEVAIPSSESSERVNDMDWPVGNKFYKTDRYYLGKFKEKINNKVNKHDIDFGVTPLLESCVRLLNSPSTPSWQSPIGHVIVASREAASSYKDSLVISLCYNQWMHDVFYSFRGVHSSNNFIHLNTALGQRGIIRDHDKQELLSTIDSSLLGELKESGLSIIIFVSDYARSPSWARELVKIGRFIKKMKQHTIFPVSTLSYNIEQSKVDELTKRYTIVFDKDEKYFNENMKVQRWMDILTKVPFRQRNYWKG
ncbi:TMV resistance protein [Salix suchowensis]|nr:TMV resistance protein [Salix suchowensis]